MAMICEMCANAVRKNIAELLGGEHFYFIIRDSFHNKCVQKSILSHRIRLYQLHWHCIQSHCYPYSEDGWRNQSTPREYWKAGELFFGTYCTWIMLRSPSLNQSKNIWWKLQKLHLLWRELEWMHHIVLFRWSITELILLRIDFSLSVR